MTDKSLCAFMKTCLKKNVGEFGYTISSADMYLHTFSNHQINFDAEGESDARIKALCLFSSNVYLGKKRKRCICPSPAALNFEFIDLKQLEREIQSSLR